ncbi:TolC family protein [Leptospirillum ferriphilum]|jgi:outer membrane protein TolC|nr:TolC family protein [Leptospirillum ferriphilum]MCL5259108.1 TolC family protein [Nitrospirota bacterium]
MADMVIRDCRTRRNAIGIGRGILAVMFVMMHVLFGESAFALSTNPQGDGGTRTLTVSQAVDMALSRNPDVLSYKKTWLGTKKLEVTALAPADPQIQYLWGGGEQGNGPNGVGLPYESGSNWAIFQSFLFPGKAEVGYKINKDNTHAAYYAYRIQRVTLRNQTELACYQFLLAKKSLDLNLEMQTWFKRALEITRAKLSVGSAQILDVVNAKVQLSQARLDELTYRWQIKVARRQLNMLLNLPLDTPVNVAPVGEPKKMETSLAQLEDMALVNRPDLLSARTTLDLNRHQLSLARLGYMPDYQFEGSEGGESCYGFAGINCYYVGLQINVPLFAPIKQVKQVDSARDMVRSSDFQYQWQANQVKLNVDNTYSQVVLGYRQFRINDSQLVPQTRLAFELALTGYENQKNDFLYLINAIQSYRQALYNSYQSLINYYESLSNLEAAVGTPLPADQASDRTSPSR